MKFFISILIKGAPGSSGEKGSRGASGNVVSIFISILSPGDVLAHSKYRWN